VKESLEAPVRSGFPTIFAAHYSGCVNLVFLSRKEAHHVVQ
jgi:hypothetical protein